MSTTTTATTTEIQLVRAEDLRLRQRRRLSSPARRPVRLQQICQPLSHSLEALDLSNSSPTQTLASLRFLVLSYLADLETRLSHLNSPLFDLGITESLKAKGELTIDEARVWAKVALEMLKDIRADVCSHLPEFHFANISVKSHLPDVYDMRSRFPDMSEVRSHLPDISDVRSHLPDLTEMRTRLEDVRSRFSDLDFHRPLNYIPTLSDHLQSLQSHLSSMEYPTGLGIPSLGPSSILYDLLDSLLSSDVLSDFLPPPSRVIEGEIMLERAARDIAEAVKRSFGGSRLIKYIDLPQQWRNNPFVTQGYRFIPLEKWPLILMSLFEFHNETLNIHTHLIPLLMWSLTSIPLFDDSSSFSDTPEIAFTSFALLCLFFSTIWHTMSGCAHSGSMEFCARVDYVGIGWLISATVGTVVYYGFRCHPGVGKVYLAVCFCTGLAGNIFPFMDWFNQYEYRKWRIAFFLTLAFSAIAPVASMVYYHNFSQMVIFISPVVPSLLSYIIGLIFYATHVPERFLSQKWNDRLDSFGGGSHAIWHLWIVLAISQHKAAIRTMKGGIEACS